MAINSMIPLMVRNENLVPDFVGDRLRAAHADLYEGQAERAKQAAQQERRVFETLQGLGGRVTPEAVAQAMRTDARTGVQLQGILSKQEADQRAAAKEARDAAEATAKAAAEAQKAKREEDAAEALKARRVAGQIALVKTPEQRTAAISTALSSGDLSQEEADVLGQMEWNQFLVQQPFLIRKGEEYAKSLEAEIKQADEARKAALHPAMLRKAQNEAITGAPNAQGLTPNQQAQLDKKPAPPPDIAEYEYAKNQGFQGSLEDWKRTKANFRPQVQVNQGAQLTPEAIEMLAKSVAGGGTLPPLGRNAGATIGKVLNAAAEVAPGVNLNISKSDLKANQAALSVLSKQSAAINAFEATATRNIDVFLEQAKGVIDSGSPILNLPLRAAANMLGSTKMAAFNAARETALTEAAKVLESPGGNAALTVSGRQAVKELSNPNATVGQIVSAMRVLKNDMANRKRSQAEEISQLRANIANIGKPEGGDQPKARKITKDEYDKLPSGAVFLDPNGNERRKP